MPPAPHPFLDSPHRTFVRLSVPLLFSLIAEPLTGLADTAFVARLGAAPLAGLGVGAAVLSSVFWIFNFLGIGTQTEVARSHGGDDPARAGLANAQALVLSGLLGVLVALPAFAVLDPIVRWMGATGDLTAPAKDYMAIRLFGSPAVLITVAAFGTLRGLQDMRTPLWIAAGLNALNIVLDPVLIFGFGPVPAFGVAGAAAASVISQWLGALAAIVVTLRQTQWPARLRLNEFSGLLRIGRELIVRTASLNFFLLLTTRAATENGADAGAAHQAIRQVWAFTALFLDAFAITGQSLVAYFLGAGNLAECRRVARVVCKWSFGAGLVLAVGMVAGESVVAAALLPATSFVVFSQAWWISALAQPINALAFGTDGVHWGTGDFRYLRNAVAVSTVIGVLGLVWVDESSPQALTQIWWVTAVWITARAAFGILRIWPGIGAAPLAAQSEP